MRPVSLALLLVASVAMQAAPRGRTTRPPGAWTSPACDPYRSGAQSWYTIDNSIAGKRSPVVNATTAGPQAFATSDVRNLLFAVIDGTVQESPDAGCSWKIRAPIAGATRLIAATGGRAFAWSDTALLRIDRERVETASVPDRLIAISADSDNANHLFAIAVAGNGYESSDGGTTWARTGAIASSPLRDAAIDPLDSHHAIATGTGVLWQTHDGGANWSRFTAPDNADLLAVAFSPFERDLVWLASSTALYRSTDGGTTFARVLRSSPLIAFGSSVRLAPHPWDSQMVAFPTANGFAIFDARTNTTRVAMMVTPAAVVWSPTGRTMYIASPQVSINIY